MKTNFDRRKSLQELEQEDWGEPEYHSHLVQTCHRLRRVPLVDLNAEDLRMMVGQEISLLFLIPLSLEKLQEDPLLEASLFPGDLLCVVLDIPKKFWNIHTDMFNVLLHIITKINELHHETNTSNINYIMEKAHTLLDE